VRTKLFLGMLFMTSMLYGQNKLTIVVDGIEEVEGHILIQVYDREETVVNGKIEKVEGETVTVVFEDIASGEYAVSLFQDENDNRKLDTGMFGIPKEKYGFSNNVQAKMGPPPFSDRLFQISEDTEIAITLR
jgi:uncharacterized protein (DUF2141 family)